MTKEITTLGRGGSDTTAVAVAAVLNAECCEIIKEVDGVCSADPRIVANSKPLRQLDFASLSEMCFWGAKALHFRSVELAQSQNVPLVLKKWGGAEHSTQVMKEVMGMESGKVLAVNSMARIEHVEIDSADLNQGFEKFAQHLKQNGLSWPQLLASAFTAGKTRMMMTCDLESLDTLLRTLERSKDLRKQRETLSSYERNNRKSCPPRGSVCSGNGPQCDAMLSEIGRVDSEAAFDYAQNLSDVRSPSACNDGHAREQR